MLREVFASLRATLYERALSPLAGTFVLVWLVLNWKLVAVLLFGSNDITSRIEYVEKNYISALHNLWYPVIATVIFLLLYPILAAAAFYWFEKIATWQRKTRKRFDLDVPLSIGESVEIKRQLQEAEQRLSAVISGKERRITELEGLNLRLTDELDALRPKATPEDADRARQLSEELSKLRAENVALQERIQQTRSGDTASISGVVGGTNEAEWSADIRSMTDDEQEMAHRSLMAVAVNIADKDKWVDPELAAYTLLKGWAKKTEGGQFTLTPKGEFYGHRLT